MDDIQTKIVEERGKLKGESRSKLIWFPLWKFANAELQLMDNDTRFWYNALMERKVPKPAVHRLSGCSRHGTKLFRGSEKKSYVLYSCEMRGFCTEMYAFIVYHI